MKLSTALTIFFLVATAAAQRPLGPARPGAGLAPGSAREGPKEGPMQMMNISVPPSRVSPHHVNEEGKLKFRSQSYLVLVPVVVRDKKGQHVSGLKKEDFALFENDKPRSIALFEEVQTKTTPVQRLKLPANAYTNIGADQNPRRVTVFLLDSINTPFLDQTFGRQEVIRYLSQQVTEDELIMVLQLNSKGLHVIHDFTTDTKGLIAALQRVNSSTPAMTGHSVETRAFATAGGGVDTFSGPERTADPAARISEFISAGDASAATYQQGLAVQDTMSALLTISRALEGVPGRKSLIWLSAGFPFYLDSPSATPNGQLGTLYEHTFGALNQANVAIYSIDPRGLMNYLQDATVGGGIRDGGIGFGSRSWFHQTELDSLREFAEMTGGRPFYNSNDLAKSIGRATDDASAYYNIGYYLNKDDDKAGWRKFKVQVARSGLDVRYRKGMLVTSAMTDPEETRTIDIAAALQSPLDQTALPIVVQWLGATGGAKREVQFAVNMPGSVLTVDPDNKNKMSLEVVSVARSAKGEVVDGISQTLESNLQPARLAELRKGGFHYNNAFKLPPGRYNVKVVVRDNLTGKVGSVSAPLEVE